jgi:hypothetical protein
MKIRNARPARRATPATDPITMPAIWPPERPELSDFDAAAVAVAVTVKRAGIEEVVGRWTLEQRVVALELTQQESVALGELVPQ